MANEKTTLLGLIEADREALLATLRQDRAPATAQQVLEKALDRALMRYTEAHPDDASRRAARLTVSAMKSALPLIDSIGEARRWSHTAGETRDKGIKTMSLALLGAAGALILATLMGLILAGGRLNGPIALIEALIPAALGIGAAYWAGLKQGRPDKPAQAPADMREEFLIDPDRLWRNLHGMLLIADDLLDRAQAESEAAQLAEISPTAALDRRQAELFSTLLENTYARSDADAREMTEAMRFYLHGQGVDLVDCTPGREAWFEFLPADRPGTLRPALVAGDKVIKKGLAAR